MNGLGLLTASSTSESAFCAANSELYTINGKKISIKPTCKTSHISSISSDIECFDIECASLDSIDSTCSTVSSVSNFSMDMTELLQRMSDIDEDKSFADHGYKKMYKICDTLQGGLFKAQDMKTDKYVAIKRTEKELFEQQIAVDEDDMTFCVTENIIKEASILKHLTVDNNCIGDYIIKYIDFFESETDYYLVIEYIESETNLKQFVQIAHQHIANNKLKLKEFKKIIKYLYWQLVVTVNWLHNDMNCCHLDIVTENIMVKNSDFMEQDGYYIINPNICIKLCDWGVSEMFTNTDKANAFVCSKLGLSLENESYLSPNIFSEQLYDCRSADSWSTGMLLFECMTGKALYEPMEIWQSQDVQNGYWSLHNGDLKKYLSVNKMLKFFNNTSLDLLINLLNVNENKRFDIINVLQHRWFNLYYKNYQKQIKRKSIFQKRKSIKQKFKKKMMNFPFYQLPAILS